jgi:Cysteine-rich CWC
MADGASTCWCFTTPIPPEVLERVPAAARDLACVCRACAGGRRTPEEILALLKEIAQNR